MAALFLLAFLLWLLNHPYQGVWHDARIYGLLAANWLAPGAYSRDLFFSAGSQAPFSLFPPIYGAMVGALGLDQAAWWISIGGGALWVLACLVLARSMLGDGFASRFAVFVGAVVVVSYSPNRSTFFIGENFATARLLAIPLGLLSVAAIARNKSRWALATGIAALLLHPLHGVWSIALWALVRVNARTAFILALTPPVATLCLGVARVDLPYLRPMTGEWLEFAWNLAPDIAFKALDQSRMPLYSGALAVLWLASKRGNSGLLRALYFRALLLGVVGLSLALLASHAFPIEIVMQGQPWRVMALLLPIAAMASFDLGRSAWRSSVAGQLLVVFVVLFASLGIEWLLATIAGLVLVSLLPKVWIVPIGEWVAGRWHWFAIALAAFALSMLPAILAGWEIAGSQLLRPWWTGSDLLHGLVAGNNWHIAAILALVIGWRISERTSDIGGERLAPVAAIIFLLIGALGTAVTIPFWDRRPGPVRTTQACFVKADCAPHPFRQWIAPGEIVFWPERELTVWFEIGTANYHGEIQATGRLFSVAKFREGQRRERLIANGRNPRHLCSDPILDWVVLAREVEGLAAHGSAGNAYLYRCATLRAARSMPSIARHAS